MGARYSHARTGVVVNVDDATAETLGPEWAEAVPDEPITDAGDELADAKPARSRAKK